MQVLDLPAGRELDALVAELVFDWKIVTNRSPVKLHNRLCKDGDVVWLSSNGDMWWPDEIPEYSTDIKAAWEIFLKFIRGVIWMDISHKFTVEINNSDCRAWAETPELAICRAALLVTLKNKENNGL